MFSELLFCENEPSPVVSLWSWACFARSATDLLLVGNWTRAPDSLQLSQPRASLPQSGTTTEEVATESTKPLLSYPGFDKNEAFPWVPLPLTHSEDNIVQLKPAGALSCNPIELQQKAWLATTLLLSDSPTHCFPPFFRPSSSFARNMDKEICALNIFQCVSCMVFIPFLINLSTILTQGNKKR